MIRYVGRVEALPSWSGVDRGPSPNCPSNKLDSKFENFKHGKLEDPNSHAIQARNIGRNGIPRVSILWTFLFMADDILNN
jgi:hypothetical protein